MICAAKPRYTAAAARQHRRILAPLLRAPITPVTSPCHKTGEVVLEMGQSPVFYARIKGKVRQVQVCRPVPSSKGSLKPRRCLFRSIFLMR